MYTSPLPRLVLVMWSLAALACASEPSASSPCAAPEQSPAFRAAAAWSERLDGEMSASTAALVSDDPSSASCTLAGVRQGLAHRRGSCHEHDHGEIAQCKSDGRLAGEVAANLYCDLSIALGGLGVDELLPTGPVSECSTAFERRCHARFDAIARGRADCAPYVGTEFRAAYEVARFNQCLFSVGTGEPTCGPNGCVCENRSSCEPSCTGEGCAVSCERAGRCEATCEAGCDSSCSHVGSCVAEAGDQSSMICEHAGKCELTSGGGDVVCKDTSSCDVEVATTGTVTCERAHRCEVACPDCEVSCRQVGSCRVSLGKGSVRCERAGSCKVTCDDGRKAKRCKNGRFVCGGSCS